MATKTNSRTAADTTASDPAGSERFFGEAGRGKALLHISSQARFNPGLILLMGDKGSGRRFLLQRVLQRINQKPGLMGVIDQVVRTRADLFNAIADAFELEDIPDESPAVLEERVLDFLQTSMASHRPVVLAVEDIQLFSLSMLEELIKLLKRYKRINLLLVGDADLSAMIRQINTDNRTCHELLLKPLSRGEIRQFINWRLPFAVDGAEFEDIVNTTQGNLALLEREAHKKEQARAQRLAQKKSFLPKISLPNVSVPKLALPKPALPKLDRRVAMGLGAAVLVGLLAWSFMSYWQRPPTQPPSPAPVKTQVKKAPVPAKPPLPLEQRRPAQDAPTVAAVVAPEPVAVPPVEVPVKIVEPVPALARQVEVRATSKTEVTSKAVEVTSKAVEVTSHAETTNGMTGEAWLQSLPLKHYTLQLIAGQSRDNLERFVAKHSNLGELHIVRTQRDGADWYLVLYGDYSGWKASQEAIAALPDELKALGPWARRSAEVQALIR